MATITTENIGVLHEKLTIRLEKTDYLPAFEKALKEYSKKANIPGFRKGMVPTGLIKKMYGPSVFTDEILRSVDRELMKYLETAKMEIFAQPLPLETDFRQLDMNNPLDYVFHFEVGMKPDISLPDPGKIKITRYRVEVTEEMIDAEVTRLQNRYGNMLDKEKVDSDENILNVTFTACDAGGKLTDDGKEDNPGKKDNSLLVKYFSENTRALLMGMKTGDHLLIRLSTAFDDKEREWIMDDLGLDKNNPDEAGNHYQLNINKIGLLEKRELNEDFFNQLYPGTDIKTLADFRIKIKDEIQNYWDNMARGQIHDQLFHEWVDHTPVNFPVEFLKKWVKTQNTPEEKGKLMKTEEELEKEFPIFINQLKWTIIKDRIASDHTIKVSPDEIRDFAKFQILGYLGMNASESRQEWVNDSVEKLLKDRKYIEETHNSILTRKIFEWGESQVTPVEKAISADDFSKLVQEHRHHHHQE